MSNNQMNQSYNKIMFLSYQKVPKVKIMCSYSRRMISNKKCSVIVESVSSLTFSPVSANFPKCLRIPALKWHLFLSQ